MLSVYLRWDTINTKPVRVFIELFTSAAVEITGGPRRCKTVAYGSRSVCYSDIATYKFRLTNVSVHVSPVALL